MGVASQKLLLLLRSLEEKQLVRLRDQWQYHLASISIDIDYRLPGAFKGPNIHYELGVPALQSEIVG